MLRQRRCLARDPGPPSRGDRRISSPRTAPLGRSRLYGTLYRRRCAVGAGGRIPDRDRRLPVRACARRRGRGDRRHDRRDPHLPGRADALRRALLRRAGPRANQLARGFRADAFSYLLFLRLVPAFPFWLVNLAPRLSGVRLGPFVAATAIGIIPGAVVFALVGAGLDSVIAAQKDAYDRLPRRRTRRLPARISICRTC